MVLLEGVLLLDGELADGEVLEGVVIDGVALDAGGVVVDVLGSVTLPFDVLLVGVPVVVPLAFDVSGCVVGVVALGVVVVVCCAAAGTANAASIAAAMVYRCVMIVSLLHCVRGIPSPTNARRTSLLIPQIPCTSAAES